MVVYQQGELSQGLLKIKGKKVGLTPNFER